METVFLKGNFLYTNRVLKSRLKYLMKKIMELYQVKDSMKLKIENYISKDGLQNEKALDRYIDKVLTEKVKKSKDETNI